MLETIARLKADTEYLPYQYRDNTDNDMSMILYLPDSPVLEGEDNYQQQLMAMQIRRIVRTIIGRSTLLTPISPAATGNANEILLHTANTPFHAAIDGVVKTVYAYDTPVSGTRSIGGNRVTLPTYTTTGRHDMVYLEVWFEEVMAIDAEGTADTTVYRHGMVHGFTDPNNLKVVSYGEVHETARRAQMRGQIKTLANTTSLIGKPAKGSAAYNYADVGGFLRAGNGDISSATNLNSIDGYVYAIPILDVVRGGSAATMTSITVVAPVTATLQQLANSSLKDVAQFGADIAALYGATGTNGTRIAALESDNTALRQANTALSTQLTSATTRVTSLEKQKLVKSKHFEMDTRHLIKMGTTASYDGTFNSGTWAVCGHIFTLPQNYTLTLGEVKASLWESTWQFYVQIFNTRTNASKQWSWLPKLANGGTYNMINSRWQLSRDIPSLYIPVPEMESSTGDSQIAITMGITTTTSAQLVRNFCTANVEFIVAPK